MIALLLLWHKIFRTHNRIMNWLWTNDSQKGCDGSALECGEYWGRYCWICWYLLFDFKLQWNQSINVRRIDLSYANNDNRQPFFSRYITNVILHIEHAFGTRTKYYYWFLTDISCSLRRFFFILSNNNPFENEQSKWCFLTLCALFRYLLLILCYKIPLLSISISSFLHTRILLYGCLWIKRFIY